MLCDTFAFSRYRTAARTMIGYSMITVVCECDNGLYSYISGLIGCTQCDRLSEQQLSFWYFIIPVSLSLASNS